MYKIQVLQFYLSGIYAECVRGFTDFVKWKWGVKNFYNIKSGNSHPYLKKNGLYIAYYIDTKDDVYPIYVDVATVVDFGTRFKEQMKEDGKLFVFPRLEAFYAQMIPMPRPATSFHELALLGTFNFLVNSQNNNKERKSLIRCAPQIPLEVAKRRYDSTVYEFLECVLAPKCLLNKNPNTVSFERCMELHDLCNQSYS